MMRARFLAVLGLLACFAPSPAAGFELRLWPLLDTRTSAAESRVRVLGPIAEWRRDADSTSFHLRPLLSTTRTAHGTRGSILYPIVSWQSDPESFFVRFFGLVSYEHQPPSASERGGTREFTAFPLIFFRQDEAAGMSLSILPFYADVPDFLGYERVQMALFPLFLRLVEPLQERTWLPFPFFSRVRGKLGRGLRVWPVYGHTVLGASAETTYVAWPFYIRHVDHPGRADRITTRISWPIFTSIDGPKLQSRSWAYLLILPAYTHTIDREQHTESWGMPWPFWTLQRSLDTGERQSLRLAPFYQDRRTADFRSRFYLWPFYRVREGRGENASYARRDVFFFLYREQSDGEGDRERHIRVVFPLGISRRGPDAARRQSITLLDGLFPSNETLEHLYAPLYRLYGDERRDGVTRRDLLWEMWRWGDGLRPPLYVSWN